MPSVSTPPGSPGRSLSPPLPAPTTASAPAQKHWLFGGLAERVNIFLGTSSTAAQQAARTAQEGEQAAAALRATSEKIDTFIDKMGQYIERAGATLKTTAWGVSALTGLGIYVNAIRRPASPEDTIRDIQKIVGLSIATIGGLGWLYRVGKGVLFQVPPSNAQIPPISPRVNLQNPQELHSPSQPESPEPGAPGTSPFSSNIQELINVNVEVRAPDEIATILSEKALESGSLDLIVKNQLDSFAVFDACLDFFRNSFYVLRYYLKKSTENGSETNAFLSKFNCLRTNCLKLLEKIPAVTDLEKGKIAEFKESFTRLSTKIRSYPGSIT